MSVPMTAATMREWVIALALAQARLRERLASLPADRARRTADEAREHMHLRALLDVIETGGADGIGAGHSLIDALIAADVDPPERPGGAWWPLRTARRKLRELEDKAA